MAEQFLHGAQVIEVDDGTRPVQTVNSAIIGCVVTGPDSEDAVAASVVIGTGTAELEIAALTPGIEGNKISVRLKNPAADSAALAVTLDDKAITVSLATDAEGLITSTADAIKTALEANAEIDALITVTSGGAGVVKASATTLLSGGLDEAFPANTPTLCANNKALAARMGLDGTGPTALADIFRQTGAVVVVVRASTVDPESGNPLDAEAIQENVIAAIGALLEAESILGVAPRILIAPEFSAAKVVADELVSVARKLRAFVGVDGPNTSDAAAQAYQTLFGSDRLTVIDPYCVRSGVQHATSAAWAGAVARTDYTEGFWRSPSNIEILGFDSTARPIPHRYGDPTSASNILNESGVTTVIKQKGLKIWGNRTASADPRYLFIAVRRTADMIQDSILRAHVWANDRPITRTYLEDVAESVNSYLKSLVSLGAILGGECWPDPDLNNSNNITQGKVYFNFKFTPVYPAESITFRQFITNEYLVELTA